MKQSILLPSPTPFLCSPLSSNLQDWFEVKNLHILASDRQDVVAPTDVRGERNIVHRLGDRVDRLRLGPAPRVLAVLEDEHLAAGALRRVVTAGRNHWRVQPEHGRVPREAAERYLNADLVRKRPLG